MSLASAPAQPAPAGPRSGVRHAASWACPAALAAALPGVLLIVWNVIGADPALRQLFGMSDALATPVARTTTISVTARTGTFSPPVTLVVSGGSVTFSNSLERAVEVRAAAPAPQELAIALAPRARATVRLSRPGLYHYYDALTARPRHLVAGNMVLAPLTGGQPIRQGWIAVLGALPGLQEQLTVPTDHDLFSPKVIVATVGSTIVVANHDTDAHNFVIDPASPSGGAFIITGSDGEPPSGWQRSLVVQQPGLYHVYCTLHTTVVGTVDGWRMVAPRRTASGYADHDPMEAWIVVLPATASM